MDEENKELEEDFLDFEKIGSAAQKFVIGSGPHTVDDKSTESEIDKMIGGPDSAVKTLLEGTYVTSKVYDCITCDYDNVKNSLSAEKLESLKDRMLTNAYQYTLAVGVLEQGFSADPKVYYVNPTSEAAYEDHTEIIDDFDKEKGVMFLSITSFKLDYRIDLHIIGFKDNKILIKSEELPPGERDWIAFDYKKLIPLEEGD